MTGVPENSRRVDMTRIAKLSTASLLACLFLGAGHHRESLGEEAMEQENQRQKRQGHDGRHQE